MIRSLVQEKVTLEEGKSEFPWFFLHVPMFLTTFAPSGSTPSAQGVDLSSAAHEGNLLSIAEVKTIKFCGMTAGKPALASGILPAL